MHFPQDSKSVFHKIDKLIFKSLWKNKILRIPRIVSKKNINGGFSILKSRPTMKLSWLKWKHQCKHKQIFHCYRKHSMEANLHVNEIFQMWQRWHHKSVGKALIIQYVNEATDHTENNKIWSPPHTIHWNLPQKNWDLSMHYISNKHTL